MSNYYLILIWIAFFGFLGMTVQMKQTEKVCGVREVRMQPLWAVVLVAPLVFWAADRGYVGDTYAYMLAYADMPSSISGISEYMQTVNKDKGFYFASALIKCIVGSNDTIYFFIVAAIQAYLIFRIYRKYSSRYAMTFFLFIASTDYVSWMFNGMRQFVAVTITFAAFEFILEKKYVKAIIIILFASLFHQTALLVIPFIFICQGNAWNKKTLLFIIAAIVIIMSVDQFTNILETMLQETQYENVVSDWEMWEDDGTNILRVLVYSVPTILSLIGLRFIKTENDSVINLCTNMSIISMGLYVVSMFTSGIFIGRLPIYFSLYNYILLPWEIEHMFERRSATLMYLLMIGAYLGFYYFQMHFGWGMI